MQAVAFAAIVTLVVYTVRVWPDLPDCVPSHFGISGPPDGWGSRAGLLVLPTIATLLFVVLTFLERVPHLYNYPLDVTTANAPMVYTLGRQLVLSVKLILVVTFGFIFRTSVEVALGKATGLSVWFLPAVVGSAAGVILVALLRMRRIRGEVH